MAKTCLGLLAGVFAAQLSSFAVVSEHLDGAFIAICILLLCRQWLLAACFSLGAALFFAEAGELIASRIPQSIEGDSIVVAMQILDFPTQRNNTVSFRARPLEDHRLPDHIRLSWFAPTRPPELGDIWNLEVRLRRPRGARNPGGFDFEGWMFRERIGASGYVVDSWRNRLLVENSLTATQRMRAGFVDRILALTGNSEQTAVLAAIVVGARHLMTAEQWERYAVTGSSHLMAVSGLHIGLAAIGGYLLARVLAGLLCMITLRCNAHTLAILFGLAVALAYMQVSGFALPARRAGLMLLAAGICLLSRRQPDSRLTVCLACMAIILADPLSSLSPGFALSFAAVAALLWTSRRKQVRLPAMQLSLLLALVPITVMHFDRVSIAALPVNLIAVPMFSFVTVPFSLAGMLLDGHAQAIGDASLQLAVHSVVLLEEMLHWVAALQWASLRMPEIKASACLLVLLPAVWAVLPPGWPGRSVALLGAIGLASYSPERPPRDCARLTVLDVGQGLAAVVETHAEVLLYDTGPAYRGGGSAAENVVLPFLQSRGIGEIDRLLVSHGDLDHAGGVEYLLGSLPVRHILAGETLPSTPAEPCRTGQTWLYSGVRFSILHPPQESRLSGNDASCVLLIEAGAYRVLLSGDIERAAEKLLLEEGALPKVHVLTLPHHGSRTSSTSALVDALQASYGIASARHGNHWGFPDDEVVARWQAAGTRVIRTASAGAVELHVCAATGIDRISAYRVVKRRIWHE